MINDHPYFTVPFSESIGYKPHHLIQASPKELIDYLIASHRRFTYQYIPQIEQNFLGLMKLTPESPSLKTIFHLFLKFQMDLQLHADLEERTMYREFLKPTGKSTKHDFSHEDEEPYLTEIISLLEKQSFSETPFCRILLTHLNNFDLELKEHAWLEENLVINRLE